MPTRSSVSARWNQRCVSASNRHDGSVISGPRAPVVRLIAAGETVERVLVDRSELQVAGRVVDLDDVVDRLHDEPVARAQSLIRRLHRKLVAGVREPLLEEIKAVEAPYDLGVRFGLGVALQLFCVADGARDAAIDDLPSRIETPAVVAAAARVVTEHRAVDFVRLGAARRSAERRRDRARRARRRKRHAKRCSRRGRCTSEHKHDGRRCGPIQAMFPLH